MKSASVTYHAPGSEDRVLSWYKGALAGCGYRLNGSGSSGTRGVEMSRGITYTRQDGRNQIQVSLSFAAARDGGTLVLYVVIELTPPVYPVPGSILRVPGSPVQLTITRYSGMNPGVGALRPLRMVTVNSQSTVASLATEINNLPKLTAAFMSCPMDDGSHDTLVFRDADGSQDVVTISLRGCQTVAAPPAPPGRLFDDPKLLPRIEALLQGPGSKAAPPVYDARTLQPVHIRRLGSGPGRFLSTGQNGQNMLYTSGGNLVLEAAATRKKRMLAHHIADASLDIDDFQALARPAGAKSLASLELIDTKTDNVRHFGLPDGSRLLGRTAGAGPAGLSDALACNLQYIFFVKGRQVGGIDPQQPANDKFRSAGFLPTSTPGELMAISCFGDQLAIYRPNHGITIYQPGSGEDSGRVLHHFAAHHVTFLSWAPDEIHLAYRADSQLSVLNVRNGHTRHLMRLGSDTIHGAAWDPWSHVLALSVTVPHMPDTTSRVILLNSGGTGKGTLKLPFAGAAGLRWSSFHGAIIGLTRSTATGTQAWAISLPPMPADPGEPS